MATIGKKVLEVLAADKVVKVHFSAMVGVANPLTMAP